MLYKLYLGKTYKNILPNCHSKRLLIRVLWLQAIGTDCGQSRWGNFERILSRQLIELNMNGLFLWAISFLHSRTFFVLLFGQYHGYEYFELKGGELCVLNTDIVNSFLAAPFPLSLFSSSIFPKQQDKVASCLCTREAAAFSASVSVTSYSICFLYSETFRNLSVDSPYVVVVLCF